MGSFNQYWVVGKQEVERHAREPIAGLLPKSSDIWQRKQSRSPSAEARQHRLNRNHPAPSEIVMRLIQMFQRWHENNGAIPSAGE
jgi:hypothetical protein